MWGLVGQLSTFMLAAWTPNRPGDIASGFSNVYSSLQESGPIYQLATDTLRFSYVSPPKNDGTSTWNNASTWGDMTRPDGSKPLAVYIPGLDGFGISAQGYQFNDLARTFELWRMTQMLDDRSSFSEVVNAISEFVRSKNNEDRDRKVVLIGESCGGLLAAAAAVKLQAGSNENSLDGLVLVNPATSFDQTAWESLVPILASLKNLEPEVKGDNELTPYAVVGSLILSGIIPDDDQFNRITQQIMSVESLKSPSFDQLGEFLEATAQSFRTTAETLPPELLEHRVSRWLTVGTAVTNPRLREIDIPTLIVVGSDDKLLPSLAESNRLIESLPNSEKLVVKNRGHFVLDENVNLTEAILYSAIDPLERTKNKAYDAVLDWRLPADEKVREAIDQTVTSLRENHSPVFFSMDARGKRWRGLNQLPKPDGPILFVGNHQFAAADLRYLFAQLWEEKRIVARGLAHPVLFMMNNVTELAGRTPGVLFEVNNRNPFPNADFQQFGALPVTPRNYYRLMKSGQTGLLFPGGAAEALSGRKDYPLFWPSKTDFVRTAARFNATIIPFSAIGMVDSVNVFVESKDILNLPFLGERARNVSQSVVAARFDAQNEDEVLLPPVAVPALPARNYVVFGSPISTLDVNHNDAEMCSQVYQDTKSAVRKGLDDLLRARQHDPFLDTPKRFAYEKVFGKQAPTFPVSELNEK